ncbi:MAG: hypothetical protein K8R92_02975 [Planctomycetes bacterium]|nr:hypothetical protein [Planctomycetota bacterium]
MAEPTPEIFGITMILIVSVVVAICVGLLSIPLVMVLRTSRRRRRGELREERKSGTKVVDAWSESARRMGKDR